MDSIGGRLDRNRGVGPGFDTLRVALAIGVVAWHSGAIVTGSEAAGARTPAWIAGYALLAMFFALSGFLIAASAGRLRLRDFLLNRALRIFPALIVEVLLCAFVLGPLVTTLPLGRYLASGGTWTYLTNVVALINFTLPGVFADHPVHFVNVSIWTVPYEFGCYAIMAAILLLGLLRRPALIVVAALAVVALGSLILALMPDAATPFTASGSMLLIVAGPDSRVIVAFLLGVAAYQLRHRLPYHPSLAMVAVAIWIVLDLCGPTERIGVPLLNLVGVPALVYLTLFVGVSRVPTLPLFRRGDYSYGIYLYGFPIQQLVFGLTPEVTSVVGQFLLALPPIALFAAVSWHGVEKPVLRLRKRFSFVARVRLAEPAPAELRQPLAIPA